MDTPELKIIEESFAVCRLEVTEKIPLWSLESGFFSISRTDDELSIVCEQKVVPEGVKCEKNFRMLKVLGPLDFSLTGILARISAVLAASKISIFAISTFDTDYILVKMESLNMAVDALRLDGYNIM